MVSTPALQNNGGQALHLLTIALKADSGKIRYQEIMKNNMLQGQIFDLDK